MPIHAQIHAVSIQISWFSALSLVLFGLLLIFAGKFLTRVFVSFASGMIAGLVVFEMANSLGMGRVGSLLLFLVFFIVFVLIGWLFLKLAVAIVFATNIWLLLQAFLGYQNITQPLSMIILILLLIIAYLISELLIGLAIVMIGALSLFMGLSVFVGPLVSFIITLVILALRIYAKQR